MKSLLSLIPFIVILAIAAIMIAKISKDSTHKKISDSSVKSPLIGELITDIELNNIYKDKKSISFQTYKNQVTLVNVFASWCVSCVLEHPLINEISKNFEVQLIGVNWRDKKEDAIKWLEDHGNPYDYVGYDDIGKYGVSIGIKAVPESFVVNKEGVIIYHHRGNINKGFVEELEKIVSKLN